MTRVLVSYATKHGATAEIAELIADELRHHGLDVDRLEASEVRSLATYEAVVLGSAVYAKRWRKSARQFLRRHQRVLRQIPFWVFSSGPMGEQKDEAKAAEWAEPPKVVKIVERLGAREHVVFGGRVPLEPRNFIERAMLKNTPPEFADLRDWVAIRSWASGVATEINAQASHPASPA